MNEYKNVLIIGAGKAGGLLLKDIEENHPNCKVVGFVDDVKKENKINVLGRIEDLSKINKIYKIDEMIIAIPSANGELVRRILLKNLSNRIPIKIVPRSQKIISSSNVNYCEVKNLDSEDFLGRPFVKGNIEKLKHFYKGKVILITGGAGSIGSEIVRQLLDLEVKKVIVYDNSEYAIFNLDQGLKEKGVLKNKYKLIIGNILNHKKFDCIIKEEKPDMVFHAAAYKHVYLMEDNIDEAVLNNVIGTKKVIDAVIENNIKQFTFISTDKVVNPTSVMGATKKLCEYYIKSLNSEKTKFNIVRFGNVINSNGSALPLFERQSRDNKYITITHKKMKRFFMSIREAARLVIESTGEKSSDSIHILNMGDLINIYEVAQCLVRSRNLIPEDDIEFKIIGLRKGEKMVEELYTEVEKNNLIKTKMENVFTLKNFEKCPANITGILSDLEKLALEFNNSIRVEVKKYLKKVFPSLIIK